MKVVIDLDPCINRIRPVSAARLDPTSRTVPPRRRVDDSHGATFTRRTMLTLPILAATAATPLRSLSFTPPPSGFQLYQDVLDGYEFLVKDDWLPVTSAGNDVAFRSLLHPEQNLFVNISSPSTSRFNSISDVGDPEEVGRNLLRQYLTEFMSTRIGIVREGEFIESNERIASDGKKYYDIEVVLRSFASRNQLAVTREDRQRDVELEWERTLFTVIGVANRRKYEFRLQADINTSQADLETLSYMANSFRCTEV